MTSATVENYLKTLYVLGQDADPELVPLGKVADALGVAPGTATTMMKRLAATGLVHYEPREGAALSESGNEIALQVLRRHRVIELFLVEFLGLDWSEVHEEAEILEHVVSQKVLARMDELLGHPTVDPHGDPIPDASGQLRPEQLQRLSECEGGRVRIARIQDHDQPFLKFLDAQGLTPGIRVSIEAYDAAADLVSVRPDGGATIRMGLGSAAKILVRVEP